MKIGALAWEIRRCAGVGEWAARLDREVAASGAELLVMPEYAPLEASATGELATELAAGIAVAAQQVEAARDIARSRRVWLLPGTMPFADRINRAPLIAPDGTVAYQDKHVMTRFEAEQWGIRSGARPRVFDTPWGKVGIAICFDLEFPGLVRGQVEAGARLILAPSCTDTVHGFNRVRIAAAARAMENQCYVALAPTVGDAPWSAALDRNRGRTMIVGPVDRGFPEDGVIAAGAADQPGWITAELDFDAIDTVRQHGAVRNHLSWPT